MIAALAVRLVTGPRLAGRDSHLAPGAHVDLGGLYQSALPRLRKIAAGLGLSPADAEDALQDAWLALLRQDRRPADPLAAGRWLTRVFANRCLLEHRRRTRWQRLRRRLVGRRPQEIGQPVQEEVRAGLWELPCEDRVLLVLRYFCAYDAPEIAALLGIPAGTVRRRLCRARLALAERLISKGLVDDAS